MGGSVTDSLLPCPFCGEAEHLELYPSREEIVVQGDDGAVIYGDDGEPPVQEVAVVECFICLGGAPLTVWNARPNAVSPAHREGYLAYLLAPEPA